MSTTNYRTNPDLLAQQMGVRIRTAVTPHGWWGVYDHPHRLITLRPGMGPIQARCTLMHELGHAHYGHTGVSGKQELLANRWAAYRLVDFEQLLNVAPVEQSTPGIAAALNVLPSVLETYLKTLTLRELSHLRAAVARRAA